MKTLAISGLFLFSLSCAPIQKSADAVEEAFGTTGALLTTAERKTSNPAAIEDRRFDQLVEIYFETSFHLSPSRATSAGLHEWDKQLAAVTRKDFEQAIHTLHQLDRDLTAIDRHALSDGRAIDLEILSSKVKANLLDLEVLRSWEKDPNFYLGVVSESAFSLSARNFAPVNSRLESLIARQKQVPTLLQTARENLKNPPQIYTEIALDQADGAVRFFEQELTQAFAGADSKDLLAQFEASNRQCVEALKDYRQWLEKELLPQSRGEYSIGTDSFQKRLLYHEMVDTPLPTLLTKGEEELSRLRAAAREIAAQIHPGVDLKTVFKRLSAEHPTASDLVATTSAGLDSIRKFCVDRDLVRFPSEKPPIVRETPPFRRSLSFASMDTPGAYENKATEAYYSVTLPDSSWPVEKQEELLRFFNPWSLPIVSIHEVYPGHYTQFLWVKEAPSKVRKLLSSSSNAEGWAHYCEEMALDEGFGNGDPRMRLAQIQLALVRAARYLVAIRMHTRGMTISEATNFFMDHAYLDRANAEREAKRGTSDPGYLVYTLGKKMILKLREDYQAANGAGYSLGAFHNAFLSCGAPPIPIVRKLLIPETVESSL